jgi:hypothetical protein
VADCTELQNSKLGLLGNKREHSKKNMKATLIDHVAQNTDGSEQSPAASTVPQEHPGCCLTTGGQRELVVGRLVTSSL